LSDRWQLPIFGLFAVFMMAPFIGCPTNPVVVVRDFDAEVFEVEYLDFMDATYVYTVGHTWFKVHGNLSETIASGRVYHFNFQRVENGFWDMVEAVPR
jgi:hypothetical protein